MSYGRSCSGSASGSVTEVRCPANLMEHIVGSERKAGKKALRLDVIENNTAAEGLYQKLGFRYIQTKTLFYEVVGEMTFKMYELVL